MELQGSCGTNFSVFFFILCVVAKVVVIAFTLSVDFVTESLIHCLTSSNRLLLHQTSVVENTEHLFQFSVLCHVLLILGGWGGGMILTCIMNSFISSNLIHNSYINSTKLNASYAIVQAIFEQLYFFCVEFIVRQVLYSSIELLLVFISSWWCRVL